MPYIKQTKRNQLDLYITELVSRVTTVGEVNYVITKLLTRYFSKRCPCYASFNAAIGVLECVKQELYRRVVAPYEDTKKEKEGDVYD